MCITCGCGGHHHHHHDHDHPHDHHHHDHHHHEHHHTHDASISNERAIAIEEDILGRNNAIAAQNRAIFRQKRVLALNLVSSPGSGKTELLTQTILQAKDQLNMAVIEGDQQTSNDADRIRVTGAPAHQINTGKGCHLDANMIQEALQMMSLQDDSVLFIENVGNLVCPAEFDLGEAHKVAILSVTEGEDKPIKYPDMFRAADIMIINKVDLLPYLRFDIDKCEENARKVNPNIRIFRTSATTKEGLDQWIKWLTMQLAWCRMQ